MSAQIWTSLDQARNSICWYIFTNARRLNHSCAIVKLCTDSASNNRVGRRIRDPSARSSTGLHKACLLTPETSIEMDAVQHSVTLRATIKRRMLDSQ